MRSEPLTHSELEVQALPCVRRTYPYALVLNNLCTSENAANPKFARLRSSLARIANEQLTRSRAGRQGRASPPVS